jgi:hypothetical protein
MLQLQKEWLQCYTTNFSGYCRTRRSISPHNAELPRDGAYESTIGCPLSKSQIGPRTWHVAPRQATNRAQLLFDALNIIVHQCHRSNQHGKSWSMRRSAELPLFWLRKFTPLCASWVEHGGTFSCGSGELLEAARFAPPRADFWEIPPGLRSLCSNARADIDGLRRVPGLDILREGIAPMPNLKCSSPKSDLGDTWCQLLRGCLKHGGWEGWSCRG